MRSIAENKQSIFQMIDKLKLHELNCQQMNWLIQYIRNAPIATRHD